MNDFEFHAPASLEEAFSLLDRYGEAARPMSGGTALVILMKQSLVNPEHVVSLERIPGLSGIRFDSEGLRIGGLTRRYDVEHSAEVRRFAPVLCDIYHRVATVKVRNIRKLSSIAMPSAPPSSGSVARPSSSSSAGSKYASRNKAGSMVSTISIAFSMSSRHGPKATPVGCEA